MSRFKVLPPVSSARHEGGGGDRAGRSRGPDGAKISSMPAGLLTLLGQIGPKLLAKGGMAIDTKPTLAGCDVVGLYFGSSGTRACSVFAAALDRVLGALQKRGKRLEVVLVSADKDRRAFETYVNAMPPWLHAIPFESPCRLKAKRSLALKAAPSLVLFDGRTGDIITAQGVAAIREDPTGGRFPWTPTPEPAPEISSISVTSSGSLPAYATPVTAKPSTTVSECQLSSEIPPSIIYYWLCPEIPSYRKNWRTPWPKCAPNS